MKLKTISTLLLVISAIFLAACGGGAEEEAAAPAAIDVVQNDIYFGDTPTNQEDPPTWTVPAGETITVNVTNNGALEHNFAIVRADAEIPEGFTGEANSDIILQETGLVAGGQTATQALTPLQTGEYIVVCTVAGHYPGMQGLLVVN